VGNKTIYTSSSESSVRIFGTITISYNLRSVFQDGKLIESSVASYKNGKVSGDTQTKWNGTNYEIIKDDEKRTISHPITKTSVQLYFNPPTPYEQIFSEKEGDIRVAKQAGSGAYLVAEEGGRKGSTFNYQNNQISEVNVPFILGEFSIKR